MAAALAAALEAANVRTWWDALLTTDEPFEQQIQRVLADAKVIVAILSAEALGSEWVRWELSQASQHGLHVVPLLVNGARSGQLPPPLHLLPSLALPALEDEFVRGVARQIRELIATIERRPARAPANDARRRLASAAADIARQAADIKQRKAQRGPGPSILTIGVPRYGESEEPATGYSMSEGLIAFLRDENIAIAFTSFQTGHLFLLGRTAAAQLSVDVRPFRKPMGLCVGGGAIVIGTLGHVCRMENILRPGQSLDGTFSHCYVPRTCHLTGVVDMHDVAMTADGDPVFVASRYNCLAALSPVHGFRPIWRPPFVSDLVAEDRCHLNGLAMRDGRAAYVTASAASNRYDGWRDRLADGGVVIDVQTNGIVCEGLSMPHSPRIHGDRLWMLNSGAGELGYIDRAGRQAGRFQPIAYCPGFVRGLAFHRHFAFVGLSRPRHDDRFAGLPLQTRFRDSSEDAWCGIQIIDTSSGRCVEWFRVEGATREIYDVAALPGVSCPRSVGQLEDEALDLVTVEDFESSRPPS